MRELRFKEWLANLDSKKPVFSDYEVASMYFHNNQLKVREIAQKCGRSIGEVYRILHRFGSPNRQISNHENVLSFADAGFPINKIAEFTGYTPRNVRYILKKQEG
ncbi:MAG: hypothetical protein DWQ19_11885 [Crenarchaeota archaeon]|nr:MAG: hypothetical protein DWQ19_11885 [Thermoproteota archaeon]